jgi:hypothetical protein
MASLLSSVMADPVCLCLKGSMFYISTRSLPLSSTALEQFDPIWECSLHTTLTSFSLS